MSVSELHKYNTTASDRHVRIIRSVNIRYVLPFDGDWLICSTALGNYVLEMYFQLTDHVTNSEEYKKDGAAISGLSQTPQSCH